VDALQVESTISMPALELSKKFGSFSQPDMRFMRLDYGLGHMALLRGITCPIRSRERVPRVLISMIESSGTI
jgi:hypothetical protein